MIRTLWRSLRTVAVSVAVATLLLVSAVTAAAVVIVMGCYLALFNPSPSLLMRVLANRRENKPE